MTTVMVMTAVVGVLAGLAARAIMPGKQVMGFFGTAVVGAIGALGAGYGGQAMAWYKLGEPLGVRRRRRRRDRPDLRRVALLPMR